MRVVLCCLLLVSACAGAGGPPSSSPVSADQAQSLPEEEAIAVIDDVLVQSKVTPVAGWLVELSGSGQLEVDVRLGDSSFGIEWVSRKDRESYGQALPAPDPQGQLRLLNGNSSNAARGPLVLLLDEESYVFEPPRRTGRRQASAGQARERLRRDITDFLDYVRSQQQLLTNDPS